MRTSRPRTRGPCSIAMWICAGISRDCVTGARRRWRIRNAGRATTTTTGRLLSTTGKCRACMPRPAVAATSRHRTPASRWAWPMRCVDRGKVRVRAGRVAGFSSERSAALGNVLCKGGMREQLAAALLQQCLFPFQRRTDRSAETGIGDVVARVRARGQEAARELVHALRAGLEPMQPTPQAEVDALVIAKFEMQARRLFERAPVAAVQGVGAGQEQRARDDAAFVARERDVRMLRKSRAEVAEEIQRQGRRVAFLVEGVGIEVMHRAPVVVAQRTAVAELALDAGVRDLRALAADSAAALVGEGAEKILEVAPAVEVAPLELPVGAREPRVVEGAGVFITQEVDVRRRQAGPLGQLAQPGRKRCAMLRGAWPVTGQQARTGHRRVGYGAQELRIVIAARTFPGIRPGPVEHVLAMRVGFHVQGQGAD